MADPSSTAESPAAQAVFDTYELLEDILLHVPIQRLLYLQRVSKQWRDVIADSTKIQKALFKKPISNEYLVCDPEVDSDDEDSSSEEEQEEEERYRSIYDDDYPEPENYVWQDEFGKITGPVLNPFVAQILNNNRRYGWKFLNYFFDESSDKLPKGKGWEHSWKDMYLTQPPCSSITFICDLTHATPDEMDQDKVRQATPITLVDFASHLRRHLQECGPCLDAYWCPRDGENWKIETEEIAQATIEGGAWRVSGFEMHAGFEKWRRQAYEEEDEES